MALKCHVFLLSGALRPYPYRAGRPGRSVIWSRRRERLRKEMRNAIANGGLNKCTSVFRWHSKNTHLSSLGMLGT